MILCVVMFATLLPTFAFADLATPTLTGASATANGIKVKWNAVSGAEMYRVFRKNGTKWDKLADTTKTSYTDTNVADGTSYTYTVRCVNAAGTKFTSNYDHTGVTGTWSKTVLAAPQLISAKSTSGGITVQWITIEGISKYRIYRKSGSSAWAQIADVSGNSYKDTSVKTGKTYTYTVRCLNSTGKVCSAYDSTGVTATYNAYATPQLIEAVAGADGITVKWKAVSGAPMYQVWRKTSGSWAKLAKTTATSYTDKATNVGVTYYYTVRVCDSSGNMLSGYETPGVSASFAGKAQVSSVTAAQTGVQIEWPAVAGAAKYAVGRKSGEGGWVKIKEVAATKYLDTTAVSGTTYSYRVIALDSSGNQVGTYDAVGKSITYYAPPHLISAEREGTGIRVKWDSVEGISDYRVYRRVNAGSWVVLTEVSATSYLDPNVANDVEPLYTVRCLKGGSLVSSYETPGVSATSQIFHDQPLLTGCVPVANGIKVTWQAVADVTKYMILRHDTSHTNATWEEYKIVSGTEFIDVVPDIKVGGRYSYTVACVDSSDVISSKYNEVGLSATYYPAPTLVAAKNMPGGVEISWKAVDGVGSYNIYRKTGSGSWTRIASGVPANAYLDTTAKSTYHYFYSVACVTGGAESSAYDETGKDTVFYAAPSLGGVGAIANGVRVSWGKVDGIIQFNIWRKDNGGAWTKIASGVSGYTYDDTTVVAGHTYKYTVRCAKSGSDVSGYYDPNNSTNTIKYFAAPVLVSATGGTGKVVFKWQAVSGATYYQVYRKTETGSWGKLGSPTTSLSFTDTTGIKGLNYYYTVRVCDKNGNMLSGWEKPGLLAASK